MLTVKELKEVLGLYHEDDIVYAYEGELTGIVIRKQGSSGGTLIEAPEPKHVSDNPVERAIENGEPVYCPTHGELDDPGNQATQDHRVANAPILCRACYKELTLDPN